VLADCYYEGHEGIRTICFMSFAVDACGAKQVDPALWLSELVTNWKARFGTLTSTAEVSRSAPVFDYPKRWLPIADLLVPLDA